MLPLTVLLPETVSAIPPFAVRLFVMYMLPLVEVSDNAPDDAPPTTRVLESLMSLTDVMLRALMMVAVVPMVSVAPPCPTVMVPFDSARVTGLLPRLSVIGPVLLIVPMPPIVPAPLAPVVRVKAPFAVTVPVTFMLYPVSTVTLKEPEPSLLSSRMIDEAI